MSAETTFFQDIALVFIAALAGGALAQWLRQPLFVGYIIGGLLISPFTPGPAVQDLPTFELFAQIGIILLMFTIGIEFSLHEMTRLGPPVLLGAPLVMGLMILLAMVLGGFLGWPLTQAAAVGAVVAVASTMVVVKLMAERGETHSPHSRLSIGTLLTEDLVVVGLFVLLPVLAGKGEDPLRSVGVALGRAALVLVPFFYLANRIVPLVLARVARRGSTEMLILVAMAIGVGTAALSSGLGLSLALGAFLGGLIISESAFTHEVLARLLPMRDVFGALFFVSVGTLILPTDLAGGLPILLALLVLIIPGKFGLRLLVLRAFRYPWPTAALVSVHLAQTGEFSFVLAQVARGLGLITDVLYQGLLTASLVSILITAALSDLAHHWIEEPPPRIASGRARKSEVEHGNPNPMSAVLICGFGRVGGTVGEALEAFRISYTVVDLDFAVIEALRARGVPAVYGDVSGEPVLRMAGAETARLAVVATPDFERARLAVRRLRKLNPTMPILTRSTHALQRGEMLEAGATEVIQPEFEAAITLLRHGLEQLGLPHEEIKSYMEQQRGIEFTQSLSPLEPRAPHPLRTKSVRIGTGHWDDVSLRRSRVRERTGVSVLSVRRADGTEVVNPEADVILRAGDEVTVIGLPEQIALFEELNVPQGLESADGL